MARKKVINRGQNQDLIGGNFTNVASETIFSLGDFAVESNFTGKKTRDYSNTLSSFGKEITLETLGLTSEQSNSVFEFTNSVTLNFDKSDIKSYVKFGSASELFRVSSEQVIFNYPASLFINTQSTVGGNSTVFDFSYDPFSNISTFRIPSAIISNPYGILFDRGNPAIPDDNELKNINISFEKFSIWRKDKPEENDFNVVGYTGDTPNNSNIWVQVNGNPFPEITGTSLTINYHIKPNVLEFNKFLRNLNQLESYFVSDRLDNHSGFQVELKRITLLETGSIIYTTENLLWNTSDGYNPNIEGSLFEAFINTLLSIGAEYDKIKTDLIARFLTPTSLKLYDLTDEGKMTKLLRIYGREFDELRLFIDAIVNINKTTYDKKDNIPDILVKNLAKTMGWDVFDLVTELDITEAFFSSEKEFNENDLLPAEIDIELWRRILINTNYYWKSKGTRHAIKSMFMLIGIPEPFINITEYIYTVDGKINPDEVELSLEDIPSASFPFNSEGYPIAPVETNDFYFQISGNSDNGQEYIDNFRNLGFSVNRTVDNKKSWIKDEFTERVHPSTPNYFQEDSKLIINTKEVDVTLDLARGIEYDVYCYNKFVDNPITSTGVTQPYVYINMELDVIDPTTFQLPEVPMSGSNVQLNYNGITLTPLVSGATDYDYTYNTGGTGASVTINPSTMVSATTGQDVITVTYLYNRLGNTGYTQIEYLVQAPNITVGGTILQLTEEPKGDVQLVVNGISLSKGTTLFSGDFVINPSDRTQLIIQNNDLKTYLLTNPIVRTWYIRDGSLPSNAEKRSEVHRVDSFSSTKLTYNAGINKYIYTLDYTAFDLDAIKMTVNGITLQNGTDFTLNPLNKKQVYLPPSINLGFIIGAYYIVDDGSFIPPLLPADPTFPDIEDMSFLEYLELIRRRLINVPRRKTITNNTSGYYPTVQHIYDQYLKRSFLPESDGLHSNGYTFENLYPFINQYNGFFNRFVNELLPATIIIGKGGILIRNTAFTRQKFRYPRGVNFDPNLEYLGDDASTIMVVQPQTAYSWSINLICVTNITTTNARRHELICDMLQPSGFTTVTTSTTYNINDAFDTYLAISLASLAALSDSAYADRVTDFLIYIGVSTELERNNLLSTSTFDSPSCITLTTTTTTTLAPITTTTTTTLPPIGIKFNTWVNTMVELGDGNYLIGGIFSTYNTVSHNKIIVLDQNTGLPEPSFNSTFVGTSSANVPNSVIDDYTFTGRWTNFDGITQFITLNGRMNSSGGKDATFTAIGGSGNWGTKIKKRTDGKYISVGGNDYNGEPNATNYVRFLNDGTIDPTFIVDLFSPARNVGGTVLDFIEINGGADVILVGVFQPTLTAPFRTGMIIKIDANNTASDPSFVAGGSGFTYTGSAGRINSIDYTFDGKYIVGGKFDLFDGSPIKNNIAVIDSSGNLDTSFNSAGTGFIDGDVKKVLKTSDNGYLVSGFFSGYNGVSSGALVKLNSNGTIDPTFNVGLGLSGDALGTLNYPAVDIIETSDGNYLLGGAFKFYNGQPHEHIVKVDFNGNVVW